MKRIKIIPVVMCLCLFLGACQEKGEVEEGNQQENNKTDTSEQDSSDNDNKDLEEDRQELSTDDGQKYITSEEVDLRQMVVQYMYDMANIEWTAGMLIDYSEQADPSLVYQPGQKYLGMVYNNNQTGLEMFQSVLDESNTYMSENTSWNESPGNSCATSIKHAWQQVSASVEFSYSMDMLPYYEDTGVIAVGDINWDEYDGKNTLISVLNRNEREVLMEAYALVLPGDALVRYLDTGGHALMVTKEPTIVRDADGKIDPAQSYVYLTDQNNRLHTRREYPSSWEVDRPVTFENACLEGYLPVTTAELRDGKAPVPKFEVSSTPTADDLSQGNLKGSVKCNYCINTITAEVISDGETVASVETYPYSRNFGFKTIKKDLNLDELSAGNYCLVIVAEIGLGTETLVEIEFTK